MYFAFFGGLPPKNVRLLLFFLGTCQNVTLHFGRRWTYQQGTSHKTKFQFYKLTPSPMPSKASAHVPHLLLQHHQLAFATPLTHPVKLSRKIREHVNQLSVRRGGGGEKRSLYYVPRCQVAFNPRPPQKKNNKPTKNGTMHLGGPLTVLWGEEPERREVSEGGTCLSPTA